ncbi:MAG: lactoylglutathione lyase [Flavobacteriales bacterium]|jgi:lactoylglutathione lyase
MKLEHVAVWVEDLESMKNFYCKRFGFIAGDKYHNAKKQFTSYFLTSVSNEGSRLELMTRPNMPESDIGQNQVVGLSHLGFSVGSREKVIELSDQLLLENCQLLSGPRTTGDGYFESLMLDPEGNRIEITL